MSIFWGEYEGFVSRRWPTAIPVRYAGFTGGGSTRTREKKFHMIGLALVAVAESIELRTIECGFARRRGLLVRITCGTIPPHAAWEGDL